MLAGNVETSEWLDFFYQGNDAHMIKWNDLDGDVGYAACTRSKWAKGPFEYYRTRSAECGFLC